jgi:penicillin-binding protein 2
MVEKYLTDSISRPKYYVDRLLEANLLPGAADKPKVRKKESSDSLKTKVQTSKPVSTATTR